MMTDRRTAAALMGLLWLATGCGDGDHGGPDAATPTALATATRMATSPVTTPTPPPAPSRTDTAHSTPTATVADCCTPTATPTGMASATVTPTSTPQLPVITFFGLARADDLALVPTEIDAAGRPVYVRGQGQAMTLVLEARRGLRPLGTSAYEPSGALPGVEFLVSRPLGDGSPAVCDVVSPMLGGVPGIDPPVFSDEREVQAAIDDLGCRVNDGTGFPAARSGENACTRMEPSFEYGLVDATSDLQYCMPIARAWAFAVGDTIVAARVRDVTGTLSVTREIVVRVERAQPFECDTGLGERVFTVERPASRLVTSATGSADASVDPWRPSQLRICAGRAIAEGIYPLSLREDAVLGVTLANGGVLCARLGARGSSGFLDCNGGSAADVEALQDVEGSTRIAVDSGLGLDAGTGAAMIRAPIAFMELAAGARPDDCADAEYPPPFNGALTTATGTAQVVDGDSVVAEASAAGMTFDCETWRDPGTGALVMPFPIVNPPAAGRAAVLVLGE